MIKDIMVHDLMSTDRAKTDRGYSVIEYQEPELNRLPQRCILRSCRILESRVWCEISDDAIILRVVAGSHRVSI